MNQNSKDKIPRFTKSRELKPTWLDTLVIELGTIAEGLLFLLEAEGVGKETLAWGAGAGAAAGEATPLSSTFTSSFIPPRQCNLFPQIK